MTDFAEEIKALNQRLKELRMHELLKRIIQNHCINLKTKYQFEYKQIHSGKIKLKALKNGGMLYYWYLEKERGVLRISHGNSEKQLREFFNFYQNQFKTK